MRDKIGTTIGKTLDIKKGYKINPEIKILDRVPFEKIKGLKVANQQQKEELIRQGISSDLITVISTPIETGHRGNRKGAGITL